jgi:alpha-mannosidase
MYFIKERISKILRDLNALIYQEKQVIPFYKMKEGDFPDAKAVDFNDEDWVQFSSIDRWGGRDKNFWFRVQVEIPEKFKGKTVVFEVRTGREGQWDAINPQFLVYVNGETIQGLDVNHRDIILTDKAVPGEKYCIALHAYSGTVEGLVELVCSTSVLDEKIEKLYYDIKVPHEIAGLLNAEDKRSIDILNYLNEGINLIDFRKPLSNEFYTTIEEADTYLEEEFYSKYCGESDIIAACIGHTHIDVAWLWTLAQTRQKAARSFSTVLNLMKRYPEYQFMSSQPQLYKFVKEDHPEIYEQIKDKVKEGNWEPEGAMWLEADCNLSSGESIVRQILHGKRFFKEEFGVDNKILWLPDVFGYSAALPQILKKSGVDYFMTTKISWNDTNKLPYDSFMWKGLDGTEVLTHFITAKDYQEQPKGHGTTYNAFINPSQIMGTWQRYQQKNLNDEVLVCYGYGDGGGGPTKEMLENARRLEKGIPGAPKVKQDKSLNFFKRLEAKVSGNKKLPKWVGELYLEYHRGTYTTMARNKKFNRKSEFLYQDTEFLAALSEKAAGGSYPKEEINKGWETILLNQFHDIIPGSSIKEVYEDSKAQYVEVINNGKELSGSAIDNIASKINLEETSVVVFNQLGFIRSDIVKFETPSGWTNADIYDANGRKLTSQVVKDYQTSNRYVLFFAEDVPAKGYKTFTVRRAEQNSSLQENNIEISRKELCNKYFDIKLDDNSNIVSIYDKVNGREVLKKGERANVIQAFEDKPNTYEAWDIYIYYQEKMWEVNDVENIEVMEEGPVRACLKVTRRFLDSTIIQYLYIYNNIPRVDFTTWIDWKEKDILLKAAFPVDIHSDKATYEIQYGNVERPTHWNTSWDYARFEVCAHKWADLSEDEYGVSLLNDCKYGHDIKESNMRLTLLKSAVYPNPDADKEVHEFTYSLYPHAGDWKKAGTVAMAYNLNCPMYVKLEEAHKGQLPKELSFISVDKENVMIEVVKHCEDSDDIIIRVYECYNRRTKAELNLLESIAAVKECNLMEEDIEELSFEGNSFDFEIKPYEIKTFKVKLKK